MKIALLTVAKQSKGSFAVAGGAAMFASQLYRAIKEYGHTPILFRVSARGDERGRVFMGGVPFQTIAEKDIAALAKTFPTIATYSYWQGRRDYTEIVLREGIPLVVHDPAEMHDEFLEYVKASSSPIISIRRIVRDALTKLGVPNTFIQHPYVRAPHGPRFYDAHARSVARLDFRKHQEIIFAANEMLREDRRAEVWGDLNRMFGFHKLDREVPNWRAHWKDVLPDDVGAVAAYRGTRFAINLTTLKGDGDGTEYAILEAWDAETVCVVHKKWIITGTDEVRHNETAIAIESPSELANLLAADLTHLERRTLIEGQLTQLATHASAHVVPQYLQTMKEKRR